MRLLGYARNVASHYAPTQFEALIAAGVDPQDVFVDETSDVGKKSSERPGMRHLLNHAKEGDTVVVWRIDRLGLSLGEVLEAVSMLNGCGIGVRSLQDGIDPTNANGRRILHLLVHLAMYDRLLNGERVAAGMATARRAGTKLGRPLADREVIANNLRTVQEARARGLTAAAAAQQVGWSRATFYRHLQEHGSQP